MSEQTYFYAVGRRKTSVARVKLYPGMGEIMVNGKPSTVLLGRSSLQRSALQPLLATGTADRFNATVKVEGGGFSSQAGAIGLALARALVKSDDSLRTILRQYGLLTRDPRMKERKKYGLKKARKAPQYTKR
ncbi:MAG: 30S ribosomal protein S9 [Chloroflexi bacterium]|nr:30S ribosomal protein S9 [Chloroflexota bacterium]